MFTRTLFTTLALTLIAAGCVNSRMPGIQNKSAANNTGLGGATGPTGSSLIDNFVIGNVLVAPAPTGAAGGAAGGGPATTIYFDPSRSTAAQGSTAAPRIDQHCSASSNGNTSAKPCQCQFTWTETNGTTGSNRSYARTVSQPVTNVQAQLVTCNAPSVYANEIDDGTTVKITVKATPGNPDASSFAVGTYSYTKTTSVAAGSFQDAQGRAFENIVHYSCYEQFKIGMAIQSKIGTETNPQNGLAERYPIANQFCVQKSGATATQDCPLLASDSKNSAQAYYYNFFTRVSLVGAVNQWNDRYTCPSIKEPIYSAGTVGSQGQLYPMDTNFALSVGSSSTFNVGVNGFVELANGGGDPIAANAKLCDGSTSAGNGSNSGFVQACLGFAAKPAADGTCPYIRDSSGSIRFTYRLRRFTALYPPLFDIDGAAPTTPQRMDQIYVLDRPVTPRAGEDPLKPYTMRGPKPCPFALFDSKGVMGFEDGLYQNQKLPIYGATNNSRWNGTNVDGIELPNRDSEYSCSTAMPLTKNDPLNPDLATVAIGTVNRNNPALPHVYIRPIRSWAPHYEEDTSFQACAPQASPVREAPLHFAKDNTTGNVSWCAEVYPSQNDHVAALDQLADPKLPASRTNGFIGHVRPYTSHVTKNSRSADCRRTVPASIPAPVSGTDVYPPASTGVCTSPALNPSGVARHPADLLMDVKNTFNVNGLPTGTANVCADKTCDRTAIVSGGLGWTQFPLLASALQTELAISSDSTYGCVLTYDGGGPKAGKRTPAGGCCGDNVTLVTGFPPTTPPTTGVPGLYNSNAHLEPDAPCLIPRY